MLNKEKYNNDLAYFISFCIETYKNSRAISGAEAAREFSNHHVIDFLTENFEVLHTQSAAWILAEINEYIKTAAS